MNYIRIVILLWLYYYDIQSKMPIHTVYSFPQGHFLLAAYHARISGWFMRDNGLDIQGSFVTLDNCASCHMPADYSAGRSVICRYRPAVPYCCRWVAAAMMPIQPIFAGIIEPSPPHWCAPLICAKTAHGPTITSLATIRRCLPPWLMKFEDIGSFIMSYLRALFYRESVDYHIAWWLR